MWKSPLKTCFTWNNKW